MPRSQARIILADLLDLPDPGSAVAGKDRSGRWPTIERQHLDRHPACEVCGGRKDLNVHHVKPYHLFPELELDLENLMTLCRGPLACHLLFGHLGDFRGFNPLVRADAAIWRFRLRARRAILKLSREGKL